MRNKRINRLSIATMSSLIIMSSATLVPAEAVDQDNNSSVIPTPESVTPIVDDIPEANVLKEGENNTVVPNTSTRVESTQETQPVTENNDIEIKPSPEAAAADTTVNINPYDIKIGDTIYANNFKYASFPLICFHRISCVTTPNVSFSVTDIKKDKRGTRFILSGFAGYKDMPLFNEKGDVVALIGGSNGGMTYAYLKSQEELDSLNAKDHKLKKGLFNQNKSNSLFAPKYAGEVDAREVDIMNNIKEPILHENGKYIKSIEYNPGTKQYKIIPQESITPGIIDTVIFGLSFVLNLIGINNSPFLDMTKFDKINSYWSEAVQLGVPNTDSMRQQFECHYRAGTFKKDWKLELGRRPLSSVDAQMLYLCNPPK